MPPAFLLPQQPAPVTRQQAALTARFLRPVQDRLAALLLDLRAETDAALSGRLGPISGKPYPYGLCRPITEDVAARLRRRLERPQEPAERAIRVFLAQGGVIREIWGALRERYFQNALQFGSLYVDVANDTVTVTKPKVEILPLSESGFEAIRGPAHFGQVAERYWGAKVFANHALPTLAPVLPIISIVPGAEPRLQSGTDYMIELFRRDGFAQSKAWLAEGPPPPPEAVAFLQARSRAALGSEEPADGAAAAIAACREARAAGAHRDKAWRNARVADYLRLQTPARSGS